MADLGEALLDDEVALQSRDEGRLLWSLASVGAQVRRVVASADDFAVDRLAGARPRAVLVVTDPRLALAGELIVALAGQVAPASIWRGRQLPRWAGPVDALLVAALDGGSPRVAGLVEQAARRGLALAVVGPAGSPVTVAAGRAPVGALPAGLNRRAARWVVLTALLQAADALDLSPAPPALLGDVARVLDEVAEACRPGSDVFTNPAKMLATELAMSHPVLAGAGPLAGVAAGMFADAVALFARMPATAITLPDGLATAGAVIAGSAEGAAGSADGGVDFFRDRLEDGRRARVVLIDEQPEQLPPYGPAGESDAVAAAQAASTLEAIAAEYDVRASRLDLPAASPLIRCAAASAFGDFTAAYLALSLGRDPSASTPGELAR